MTCHITGVLTDPGGVPMPGAVLTVLAPGILSAPSGALIPRGLMVTADAHGAVAFDLWPGAYRIKWTADVRTVYSASIGVPDEPGAALSDLIGAPAVPVRGARGAGWTGGYYDYTTGKVVFESDDGLGFETGVLGDAGAGLPSGQPGQLLGYGPGGVPEAVDPPLPKLASTQW